LHSRMKSPPLKKVAKQMMLSGGEFETVIKFRQYTSLLPFGQPDRVY